MDTYVTEFLFITITQKPKSFINHIVNYSFIYNNQYFYYVKKKGRIYNKL